MELVGAVGVRVEEREAEALAGAALSALEEVVEAGVAKGGISLAILWEAWWDP